MWGNEDVIRLLLPLAGLLVWTAGCRAANDGKPPTAQAALGNRDLAAQMEDLLRAACRQAEGVAISPPESIRHFTREDLHQYMDGAAERYLGYSFDHAAIAETHAGAEPFAIELYHFGQSADAYGMWSTDAAVEDVHLGQRSAYAAGLLQFWRGAYFVRVFHRRYLQSSREAVLAIGRATSDAIAEDGNLPDLLAELPPEGITGTPVFFHEQPVLNYLYYLSDANLLRLGPTTDAVFANYRQGDERAKLLVVRYAGDDAVAARKAFVKEYLKAKPTSGPCIVKLENGLLAGVGKPGNKALRFVFDATGRNLALRLLAPSASQ